MEERVKGNIVEDEKYVITVMYDDGTTQSYAGVDLPHITENEIAIKSPDGYEIVVNRSKVRVFTLSAY